MVPNRHRGRAPLPSPAAATVFTTVLTQGPVSRLEVARRTGLSPAAVTKASQPYIAAGYLAEVMAGEGAVGRGRPAHPLTVQADREFFIGIKITADDLIGVVTDLVADVQVIRHHLLTATAVDDVVSAVAELVTELRGEAVEFAERTHCIGIAVSGDVDHGSGVVRYSPFLGWRDVPLADLVADATGLSVTLENDVKALTLAEHWFGQGVGASSLAVVTVGSGIGSALVLNGDLVAGAHGVAGEIGHISVGDGTACHCGATGCIESIASTAAIVEQARLVTGEPDLIMEQAVDRARDGDSDLRAIFDRAGHAIGLGIAAVANLVGPERVVVSGEGLEAYDLLVDQIQTTFAQQAFGAAADCALVIRPLPFEEWARGAAVVAVRTLIFPPATITQPVSAAPRSNEIDLSAPER